MKTIIIKLMILFGLFFSAKLSNAQNILTDGNFNSTTVITPLGAPPVPLNTWCSWNNTSTVSNFSAAVIGGVCSINFLNSGNNTWDVQLSQFGFPLILGNHYRLSFDVRADANRSFGVYIGENEGQWTNLNASNYIQQANTNWQTKTIEFNATGVFALSKLSFEIGAENIGMNFDNVVLENLGFAEYPKIEIIGSSVPPYNWMAGENMYTTDGIHYLLSDYSLAAGEAKFRQNQDWSTNWGSNTFPSGYGYQNGPNIPIPAGKYTISFNRLNGEYNFTCLTCPTSIGIIGSSVPPYNWSVDVNLNTSDGINYTLPSYSLVSGELRFRQDDSWAVNWGGFSFPAGVASFNAPNIQVVSGTYNISFNKQTGEYNFQKIHPRIGIIGSAVNGWMGDDVPMNTQDGVYYSLLNYPLSNGEVKFRQDNSWSVNWGNIDFPSGYGYAGGPNIPIPAGMYNISFNKVTGEYNFCSELVVYCGENIMVYADKDYCGKVVGYNYPIVTGDCGNAVIRQIEGLPNGAIFPVGTTINTFVITSSFGKSDTCSFSVTVKDMEPPVITNVIPGMQYIWPPNHQMKDITINYNSWDNCGPVTNKLSVSSNEPVNGTGDGDTAPDWIVINDHHIKLRAERSGSGNGRIYTITVTSTDMYGNVNTTTTHVYVSHDPSGLNITGVGNKVNGDGIDAKTGNNNQLLNYTVFPNPSTQNFNLQITSASKEKIEANLYDISGRLISKLNINNNQTVRFGDELQQGIYSIEIKQGTRRKIVKVVKQ